MRINSKKKIKKVKKMKLRKIKPDAYTYQGVNYGQRKNLKMISIATKRKIVWN
jgi:hypothetical protein